MKSEDIRNGYRKRKDRKCVRTWQNAGERESAQAGDNLVNVRVKGWRLAGVNNEVMVVLDRLLETEGGRLHGVVRRQTEGSLERGVVYVYWVISLFLTIYSISNYGYQMLILIIYIIFGRRQQQQQPRRRRRQQPRTKINPSNKSIKANNTKNS